MKLLKKFSQIVNGALSRGFMYNRHRRLFEVPLTDEKFTSPVLKIFSRPL